MKNSKILITIIFVFILNIVLIITGLYYLHENKEDIIEQFEDDFKTKLFVKGVSNGATTDYNVMLNSLDSKYVDSDGNTQIGIEVDGTTGAYLSDSAKSNRRILSESIISNNFDWEDIIALGNATSFNATAKESIDLAVKLLVADKGGDKYSWGYLLDPATALLAPTVLPHGLEGLNINLIDFADIFVYEEMIDGVKTTVTYDFSTGVTEEMLVGNGTTMLGLENWDNKELHSLFCTFSFNSDLRNNGDLHRSLTSSSLFDSSSNTYFIFSKFMSKQLENYEGIKYNWFQLKKGTADETSDARTWFLANKKSNTIDSEGEALLYFMYDELNYNEYFDRALEIDGIDSFRYEYISELYGNGKFSSDEFWSEDDDDRIIYSKGQDEEITFSEFVILTKTYQPFLRSTNYEYLVSDIAEFAVSGISFSELPN